MMVRDHEYYQRRIEDETAAANATSSEYARAVHLDLVERYTQKLWEMSAPIGDEESLPEPKSAKSA